MDIVEAISGRRSIRKYLQQLVPKETIEKLLEITVLAPSGHNIQPWRFVVVEEKKKELVELLKTVTTNDPSYDFTIKSIERSAVLIMIFNNDTTENDHDRMSNLQSIGGAIQTMCLTAYSMGLGSLWITSILYAREKIEKWLGRNDEFVAAVAIGYPEKIPNSRPRISWRDITEWI